MLLRIRAGKPTKADLKCLKERHESYINMKNDETIEIKPTVLYSKKIDVATYNASKLNKCPEPTVYFYAHDTVGQLNKKIKPPTDRIIQNVTSKLENTAPDTVVLRVGAQVMLKANVDVSSGLINGSRGVVKSIQNRDSVTVKFVNSGTHIITRWSWDCSDRELNVFAVRSQIPLILAWALTIHSTQSCTIDNVVCDLGVSVFAEGQAYVALSRVRSLEGLYLSAFSPTSIKTNKQALQFCEDQAQIQASREIIDYEFSDKDGKEITEDEALDMYLKKYNVEL